MNQNSESKIITINFKENNYKFNTELAKYLNVFYNEVCNYLKIEPNKFELHCGDKIISLNSNNNITLANLIETNEEPYFRIIPKNKKTKSSVKLNLRYNGSNTNTEKKSLTTRKKTLNFLTLSSNNKPHTINKRYNNNSINNNNMTVGAIISNIPSIQDIEKILDKFQNTQNNNNNDLDIKTNNDFIKKRGVLTALGNDSVRVDFKDEIILNEFISYVSFLKYENNYYKRMIIQKDNSNLKNNLRNLSYSHKNIRSYLQNLKPKYDYNNENTLQNGSNNARIKINDVIKALKQNELNHDCYHGLSLKRDGEDEIVTDYYRQQSFLRNSSPYISENEKRILEEKENKKLFYRHKNFVTSVGKYSMKPNFIPNYVGMTPSENPNNHEFRKVDKNKWITNKGFNA